MSSEMLLELLKLRNVLPTLDDSIIWTKYKIHIIIHIKCYLYVLIQTEEIGHLISQQPTAMEAVRLKCFLQSNTHQNTTTVTDKLNKRQVSYSNNST